MDYNPENAPDEPQRLGAFLRNELRRLNLALNGAWNAFRLDERNVVLAKFGNGDVVYADGTNWNPGDGRGIYAYLSSAWNKLAAVATANNFTARQTTTDGVASGTARVIGGRATANVSATDTVTAVASNGAFVSFAQTYVIPASTLKLGSVLRCKALVVVNDATGVLTLTCNIRIGGVSMIATTAVDPGAVTDLHLLEFEFTARAAPGATASCVGAGRWVTQTGATVAHGTGLLAPTNFATNGNLTLDVQAKWSATGASTSARLEMLNVDII